MDDFTYGQVLLCFSVIMMSFAIGEMFGGGLAVFPELMREGSLDRILVRPRSVILQIIMPNMDFSRLGLLVQAVIVLCIAVPVSGVVGTGKKVFVFAMMVVCGSVLFFCLFLLVAAVSFFYHTESEFSGYFYLRYAGFREISFFCLWGCGAEGSHIRDSPGFGSVLPAAVSAGPGGGDLVYAFAAFIAVVCGAVMVVLQIRAEEL